MKIVKLIKSLNQKQFRQQIKLLLKVLRDLMLTKKLCNACFKIFHTFVLGKAFENAVLRNQ